jgi:hypothetical protein
VSRIEPPAGFATRVDGARVLLARPEILTDLLGEGLAAPATWEEILAAAGESPGRGSTARIGLRGGARLVLKRMRRGGLVGSWWSDRFAGAGRLLANLTIPVEVARRGIPTAAPAALLLEEGPRGFYRGWLATDEIAGATDLWTRLARPPAPRREVLVAAAALARRAHDAGVEHHDLNLGNLLVRESPEIEAFLVDLDGARLHDAPLPIARRRAAVRRLGRSYEKRFGRTGPLGSDGTLAWTELYAGGDAELLRELRKGLVLGRLSLAMHRAAWPRSR